MKKRGKEKVLACSLSLSSFRSFPLLRLNFDNLYNICCNISLSFPLEIATNSRLEGTTEIRKDTGKKSGQIATFIML